MDDPAPRFAPDHPYRRSAAGVATRHRKTPLLAAAFRGTGGLVLRTVDVDTDAFGTFAGDVPRPAGPARTALLKATAATAAGGPPLGLASEGTFAPSELGPVTMQRELVAFVDTRTGLEVVGHAAAPAPWVRGVVVRPDRPAALPGPPPAGHRWLVRPEPPYVDAGTPPAPVRGVASPEPLARAVREAAGRSRAGLVRVETDLRAHVCPARHAVIRLAAADLVARLARRCVDCGSPGHGPSGVVRGAPCSACGRPTGEPVATVWSCPACPARQERPRGGGPVDPGRCGACNP